MDTDTVNPVLLEAEIQYVPVVVGSLVGVNTTIGVDVNAVLYTIEADVLAETVTVDARELFAACDPRCVPISTVPRAFFSVALFSKMPHVFVMLTLFWLPM